MIMTTQLQGTAVTNATTSSEHYSCTRPQAAWKGGSQKREQLRHVYAAGGIHVKATAAGGAARWPGRQVEARRQQLWSAATAVTRDGHGGGDGDEDGRDHALASRWRRRVAALSAGTGRRWPSLSDGLGPWRRCDGCLCLGEGWERARCGFSLLRRSA